MFALLSALRLDEKFPFGDMSACCGLPQLQRHRSRLSATRRSILFRTFSCTLKEKVHKGLLALSCEKRGVPKEKVHPPARSRQRTRTKKRAYLPAFVIIPYAPSGTYFSNGLPYLISSLTNVELTNARSLDDTRITVSTSPISLLICASEIS